MTADQVARKAHELWWVARRLGYRNRPIVRWGNRLWAIGPPKNWQGCRWVEHDGQYVSIEVHNGPSTVWDGRWMGKDEWIARLVRGVFHEGDGG